MDSITTKDIRHGGIFNEDLVGNLDRMEVLPISDSVRGQDSLLLLHSPGFENTNKPRRIALLTNQRQLVEIANHLRRLVQPTVDDEILATLERIERAASLRSGTRMTLEMG